MFELSFAVKAVTNFSILLQWFGTFHALHFVKLRSNFISNSQSFRVLGYCTVINFKLISAFPYICKLRSYYISCKSRVVLSFKYLPTNSLLFFAKAVKLSFKFSASSFVWGLLVVLS